MIIQSFIDVDDMFFFIDQQIVSAEIHNQPIRIEIVKIDNRYRVGINLPQEKQMEFEFADKR